MHLCLPHTFICAYIHEWDDVGSSNTVYRMAWCYLILMTSHCHSCSSSYMLVPSTLNYFVERMCPSCVDAKWYAVMQVNSNTCWFIRWYELMYMSRPLTLKGTASTLALCVYIALPLIAYTAVHCHPSLNLSAHSHMATNIAATQPLMYNTCNDGPRILICH